MGAAVAATSVLGTLKTPAQGVFSTTITAKYNGPEIIKRGVDYQTGELFVLNASVNPTGGAWTGYTVSPAGVTNSLAGGSISGSIGTTSDGNNSYFFFQAPNSGMTCLFDVSNANITPLNSNSSVAEVQAFANAANNGGVIPGATISPTGYAPNFDFVNMAVAAVLAPPTNTITLSIVPAGPNTISLSWNTVAGQTYQPQYRTNLALDSWTSLGGAVLATNNVTTTSDQATDPQRFYRVVLSQ